MGNGNFTEDFKLDAIKQITERGHSVADVSSRLGVSTHSLYAWMERYVVPPAAAAKEDQSAEIRRLKPELSRVTEERDILKRSHRVFRQGCKMRYAFIEGHHQQFSVRRMCNMLTVHPSGFHAWLKQPFSKRTLEDERQTQLLKEA